MREIAAAKVEAIHESRCIVGLIALIRLTEAQAMRHGRRDHDPLCPQGRRVTISMRDSSFVGDFGAACIHERALCQ
jgi:hypothetical protein